VHFHGHLPGADGDDRQRNLALMMADMATRPGPESVRRMIAGRAEPLLRQAANNAADDVAAWEALGTTLAILGRPADALTAFDRALALAPEQATALEGAALAATEIGNAKEMAARCERYVAVAPQRPRGHFHLAEARAARGDWPGVIAACRESLRLDPTQVPTRTLLAKAYRETGDKAAAEREQAVIRALEAVAK
jgi:cytochrome c-type biogenesis protein CcmH/NrfG